MNVDIMISDKRYCFISLLVSMALTEDWVLSCKQGWKRVIDEIL